MSCIDPNTPGLQPLVLCDATGREIVNEARLAELASFIRVENPPMTPAAGAKKKSSWRSPGARGPIGGMEIHSLSARGNVPFTCQLTQAQQDGGWALSNAPVYDEHMFGGGPKPFKLARSIWVPAQSFMTVECTSLAASLAASLEPIAWSRWICPAGPNDKDGLALADVVEKAALARKSIPFWLVPDNTSETLTALEDSHEFFMTMPQGLRLESGYLMWHGDGPFTIEIFEYESGRELTHGGAIDVRDIAGDASDPAEAPGAFLVEQQQRVRCLVTDLSGAANTIYVTFHGPALVPASDRKERANMQAAAGGIIRP